MSQNGLVLDISSKSDSGSRFSKSIMEPQMGEELSNLDEFIADQQQIDTLDELLSGFDWTEEPSAVEEPGAEMPSTTAKPVLADKDTQISQLKQQLSQMNDLITKFQEDEKLYTETKAQHRALVADYESKLTKTDQLSNLISKYQDEEKANLETLAQYKSIILERDHLIIELNKKIIGLQNENDRLKDQLKALGNTAKSSSPVAAPKPNIRKASAPPVLNKIPLNLDPEPKQEILNIVDDWFRTADYLPDEDGYFQVSNGQNIFKANFCTESTQFLIDGEPISVKYWNELSAA